MQGTNWVKMSEQYPENGKFILFYAGGEIHAGWMTNLGSDFYDSYKHKLFCETKVSHWCYLTLPPMPEVNNHD